MVYVTACCSLAILHPFFFTSRLTQEKVDTQMLLKRVRRFHVLLATLSVFIWLGLTRLWDNTFDSLVSEAPFQPEDLVTTTEDVNYSTYLPATLSVVPNWHLSRRKPDSLSMMLPPRQYRHMTCQKLLKRHVLEHTEVNRRNSHHRNPETQRFGNLFRDPYPVCGRYLLPHLTGKVDHHVFVLRMQRTSILQNMLTVTAGEWTNDLVIEDCGNCAHTTNGCVEDVLFRARLFNDNRVVHAEVISPATFSGVQPDNLRLMSVVRFRVPDAGDYTLEVKMVHLNGGSDDFRAAKTLGLVVVQNKSVFLSYNGVCDLQRHVYGSPLRVRVLSKPNSLPSGAIPYCNFSANYNTSEGGQWVRFIDGAGSNSPEGSPHPLAVNCSSGSRYCEGDPMSLTDSGGYNNHLVWVPSVCRLRLFAKGSGGPQTLCLRTSLFRTKRTDVLFAGDSISLEYARNCWELWHEKKGFNLACRFSSFSAKASNFKRVNVAKKIRRMLNHIGTSVGVFATNLGMQHMITTATKAKWIEFVDMFVEEWKHRNLTVLRGPYTMMPPFGAPTAVGADIPLQWQQYMWEQNQRGRAAIEGVGSTVSKPPHFMEWAVWLSPPTVHYASAGMSHQREVLWDRLAYERLQKIGFVRLDALTPTSSRQESTWDGLHYLVTPRTDGFLQRVRLLVPQTYNGGVSFMLFLIFLNIICFS